ncbi:MAG TPA: hypothetical protein EYN07_01605 [Flavobacteriaceae bacterium]|nr:hypothetical protein [Flavobacteriaceae bacterium]HIN97915.1 hypothetical protein [Flavobacteriaceae bacterium]
MKFSFRHICGVLMLVTIVVSCAEISEDEKDTATETQDVNTRYGKNLVTLPPLTEVAKNETAQWSVFDDLEANLITLKNQPIGVIRAKSEQMSAQSDSLLKKIPEALDTRPVYARMVLANTRAKLLEQVANYDRLDSLQLEESLQEMNLAGANLFIEINRTFKKNKIDDELKETEKKELEKQQRFLDSVYQAEIIDNNSN